MPGRWVLDEAQSYYLESEEDSASGDLLAHGIKANSISNHNPTSFAQQYETTGQGATSLPIPGSALDTIPNPVPDGVYYATYDFFSNPTNILPLSSQHLDLELANQEALEPCSKEDFGANGPSLLGSDPSLAASNFLEDPTPLRGHHDISDLGNPSFATGYLDTVDYPGTSMMQGVCPGTNILSPFTIQDQDMGLTHQQSCSTSLPNVVHDILSNSFVGALDRPVKSFRHGVGRDKEFAQPASGQRRGRKKLRAEDQQTPRNPVNTMPVPAWLDDTLSSPLLGLKVVTGYNACLPKSRFDVYIAALGQMVRRESETRCLESEMRQAALAQGVLWAVRESWPAAEGYWNLTATFRGFLYAEIWRNFPSETTYRQLPPAYRPTRAQMMIPHSAMIDWLPWPDVRDMAIKFQDNIDMDAVFRMAIHNVVAHRKRHRGRGYYPLQLEPGKESNEPNEKTSFRAWDLVRLEKYTGVNPLAEPGLRKRPVVRSPNLRALMQAYNLEYDEFETQKLDDQFFEVYPYLYCDSAISRWKVQGFSDLPEEDVGRPIDLTSEAVSRLQSKLQSLPGKRIDVQT